MQEDFAALTNLETVKRATRDWSANARGEDWLAHRAGRLEDTERLLQRPDLIGKLDATDRLYLVACKEHQAAEKKAQVQHQAFESTFRAAATDIRIRSNVWYLLLIFFCITAAVILQISDPWFVKTMRNMVFDEYQRLDSAPAPTRETRIVAIDDQSLSAMGQWPWPRSKMRDIINTLAANGAGAIGFIIHFSEPDNMSVEQFVKRLPPEQSSQFASLIASTATNDELFASALRSTKTVLATAAGQTKADWKPTKIGPLFVLIGSNPGPFLFNAPGRIRNLQILENAATGIGCLGIATDLDGIVRRIPLVYYLEERYVPSLPLELVRLNASSPSAILVKSEVSGVKAISINQVSIATDENASIYLRLHRGAKEQYIPAWKVLSGDISEQDVKGRIILIGTTATALQTGAETPMGVLNPVELYAQAIENILSHSQLLRPSLAPLLELVIVVIMGAALAFGLPGRSPIAFVVTNLSVGFLLLAGGWLAYTKLSILFDILYPIVFLLFMSFVIVVFLYLSMEVRRRKMRASLQYPEDGN